MMHHPNMHHQAMSGHPPQHIPTHQGMPPHHQMPPHQMHRENRHVTLTRVGLGGNGAGMGGAQSLGGMGMHHAPAPAPRPPHAIRGVHHPHAQPPQQMKPMRRPYNMGASYGHMMPPPYAAPPPPVQPSPHSQPSHTVVSAQPQPSIVGVVIPTETSGEGNAEEATQHDATPSDCEARPASQANSKEKTPMCLVNELARYNKIKHQYRLTSETGPAHKKVFTVTLRLGETEEYTAEGSSIKRAQHAAASAALAGTAYPPPPARATPTHPPHLHHRHSGAVMPTVELNALAMKLCQPAVYTSIVPRVRPPAPYRMHPPFVPNNYQRMLSPGLVYRVRVTVGDRAWLGEGATPQAARHDAAARALQDLRQPPDIGTPTNNTQPEGENVSGETNADLLNSEVKSPVSLVHELALKRSLSVQFSVKSERGPPHMRVFVTTCTVGEIETEGEGNGKKVSKRRAAEKMLEEMRRTWPAALLRSRPVMDKRRTQTTKKKPRNLIKEGGVGRVEGEGGADNPISRLAMARHAARARSPQYRVLEERGAARRREFLVQCDAPPYSATGLGPNKKTAKRRAAHNVLLSMEMNGKGADTTPAATNPPDPPNGPDVASAEVKRKEGDMTGGVAGEVRQPVPGVLMMDYHQRSPQSPNGVSENSATGGGGGNTPGGAKDQLMYLAQLLGFTVQFSDFPKRNHGEYLSLVSLSTEPPVMCHGGGPSTASSHEQCSRAALRALAMMGLDAPPNAMQSMPGSGAKSGVISNGLSE